MAPTTSQTGPVRLDPKPGSLMPCRTRTLASIVSAITFLWIASPLAGAEIKLVTKAHDPYGVPRPAPNQQHVPLRTTFYVELGFADKNAKDNVLPESVGIDLQAEGSEPIALLK